MLQDHPQIPVRTLPMIRNEKRHKWRMNVFTLSSFSGVSPFNSSYDCTPLSASRTFFIRFAMILFGVLSLYYTSKRRTRPRTNTELASAGVIAVSEALGVVILIVHNFLLIRRRKLIKHCMDAAEDTDPAISKSLAYGVFYLATKFILIVIAFQLRGKYHKTSEELYYLVIHIQMYMMVLQFCSLLSKINRKMTTLVSEMSEHSADFLGHFHLVDTLNGLNKTFGWQLLVVVFQIFLHATISLYWIIIVISVPQMRWSQRLSLIPNILEAGYRFYTLLLIIRWCKNTSDQVEAFNSKLLRNIRNSERLRSNKKLYVYANMRNHVVFTASGFFILHNPLVTSIMAAVMTYLVILIQLTNR